VSTGRIAPLSREDERLCADVAAELEDAWCAQDPYTAVAAAIERLVPETHAGLIGWPGRRGQEQPRVLSRNHPDAFRIFERGYAGDGSWRRDLIYDPRRVDPLAGKAVDTDWLARLFPDQAQSVRQSLLRPNGFASILRTTVYRRSRLIAVCGHVRFSGSGPITARDRSVYERLIPLVTDGLTAVSSAASEPARAGDISALVDAIPLPVFVRSTSGRILHWNRAASRTFRQAPPWLRSDPKWAAVALPPWVRRVPLRMGGRSFEVLLVDAFDVTIAAAHLAPWAERWKLPPRHARVAALLLRGLTDKEIAQRTQLAPSSVRTYVKEVFLRAGVHSRTELIRAALAVIR
jgi:DNA-binding CsgD family transcriptional regulator/PAS domain-containing protein